MCHHCSCHLLICHYGSQNVLEILAEKCQVNEYIFYLMFEVVSWLYLSFLQLTFLNVYSLNTHKDFSHCFIRLFINSFIGSSSLTRIIVTMIIKKESSMSVWYFDNSTHNIITTIPLLIKMQTVGLGNVIFRTLSSAKKLHVHFLHWPLIVQTTCTCAVDSYHQIYK